MSKNSTAAPAAPATGFFASLANAVTSVLPGNKNSKNKTELPPSPFGSTSSNKTPVPFGTVKNNSGKNNSGKNNSGKNNSGKNNSGKNNSGKNNSGKNNSGKNKAPPPNPFATATNVTVTAPATPVTNPFVPKTTGGMAPVNFSYGPRMQQPSERVMQWATTAGVPTPTGPEMRNVAHGGKRRTHKRRTHRVKHRKSHKKHTRKHRMVKRKTQRNKRRN
uniref:Uncharacterized protein n=1 Tax=viral metagenome TaxID=1070528 RepID=A0A6C0DTH8_9ZZZZ